MTIPLLEPRLSPRLAAHVLVAFDRTCCVCHTAGLAIQLHHIDGDPAHHSLENLAVLCLECHHQTQLHGGFARRLDPAQVRLYRDHWVLSVATQQGYPSARMAILLIRLLAGREHLRQSERTAWFIWMSDFTILATQCTMHDAFLQKEVTQLCHYFLQSTEHSLQETIITIMDRIIDYLCKYFTI
jgi:hypothetical protein